MIVLKAFLCLIIFFVMPIIIGIHILRNDNEKNNLILSFIYGFIVEFAIFQFLAVPMTFMHCKLTTLIYSWVTIISILDIISVLFNIKRIKEIVIENFNKLKNIPKILSIILIMILGLQVFVSFRYMYVNDDDARFVGMAVTSIETNTLMDYDALTGREYDKVSIGDYDTRAHFVPQLRRILASYPLYTAVVSKLTLFPVAILVHSILPEILILLGYAIYSQIAKKILKFDTKDTILFLIILSFVNIFGNYSTRTNFTYFLLRIWQGKAIVAGIVIPAVWLLFFNAKNNDKNIKNWLIIFLLMFFASMASSIGIIMAPMSLMLLAFIFSISDRKFSYLIKSFICAIPCIMYAGMYFFF